MSDTTMLDRVARLIAPIVSDLHMDLYDLEFRGGTLRVTVDRAAGFEGVLDLEAISLASRLIGRELDHEDPMSGHYTLEVSSPGLERSLRTPAHFAKSVGQKVAVRLRDIDSAEGEARRVQGVLAAADEQGITVQGDDGVASTIPYHKIDRARTMFEWGPAPKPGSAKNKNKSPRKELSK